MEPGAIPGRAFVTRQFDVNGTPFDCLERYSLVKLVGHGAYGVVCAARDNVTGEMVAIKKIIGIVENVTDCRRTLRELKLLRHFRHDNVICMKDVYVSSATGPNFQDVYTVTELMDTDLHQIIKSHQPLSDAHCQDLIYQMLCALRHIHAANVLHRDLKPANVLLNENCDLKICDFGLARVNPEEQGDLTAYVATRWYRAPEIMLSRTKYTKAVDIWSVGCIIGEMLARRPLFQGRDYLHQLDLITDVVGTLSEREVEWIGSGAARKYVEAHMMHKQGTRLSELFPGANAQLRDLLARMLRFDPRERITVEDALRHPYLSELYEPAQRAPPAAVFTFDAADAADKDTLRRLIWEEILLYHPELRGAYGESYR